MGVVEAVELVAVELIKLLHVVRRVIIVLLC